MRGLLTSRLLKVSSHAESLCVSAFRHLKPRKSSKRYSTRRGKSLLLTHFAESAAATGKKKSGKEEDGCDAVPATRRGKSLLLAHCSEAVSENVEEKLRKEEDGRHAKCAVTGSDENREYAKRIRIGDAGDSNDDAEDHVVASGHDENGLKDGEEIKVMSVRESGNSGNHIDVSDVCKPIAKSQSSSKESLSSSSLSLNEKENVIEGREPPIQACPHDFNNCVCANEEWHEGNRHLQKENVESHTVSHPKGPFITPEWETVMSTIAVTPSAVSFICGGKNTGKSTFARFLINSLLNRYGKVGFLDTDVGQPEFTPSGCLSLHVLDSPIIGLPGLEMKDPERCYFFGDTSPKSNPEDYLKSVFSLFNHFNKAFGRSKTTLSKSENGMFPLVINTHGWIKGVGLDVLIKMINYVMPTYIVQTLSKKSTRNLPQNRFWESKTSFSPELLHINDALGENTHLAEIKYDARELRDLRLLAYFQRSIIDRHGLMCRLSSLFEKGASALACCKPFQVPISAIKVVQQHFQVPEKELVYSLNATLVGLGVSKDGENNTKPCCVGLGILRAVDVSRGLFYVITPLKLRALQKVNSFLQGRIEIPVSLLKAPGYFSPYLCKNMITMEGTGSAAMGKGKKKVLRMLRSPEGW